VIWDILWAFLFVVVGLVLGVIFEERMRELYARARGQKKVLNQNDVAAACEGLFNKINRDKTTFEPDYILGIDGGGCVVASYLAQRLKKPVLELSADRRDPLYPKFPKDPQEFQHLVEIIKGKNVLVTEDLSNTSGTLRDVQKLLKSVAQKQKIAVISVPHKHLWSDKGVDPYLYDYYIEKYCHKGPCTIKFPWQVWNIGHR